MDDRIINFQIFRYHLLPIETKDMQIKLFDGDKAYDPEEIRERKNEFFGYVLDGLVSSRNNSHPLRLEDSGEGYYLFKLAQSKTTVITQNFENIIIDNEPYVYIIFNNDPTVQKIAISENSEAFSKPEVVSNILKKVFQNDLEEYGLSIGIESMFNEVNFWEYANRYRDAITYINFKFIKPNLANISKSLSDAFKNLADDTNSHESHLTLKAPEKGILKNIDRSNEKINGLVQYTSEGAGSIKLKVKGLTKQLKTKDDPITVQIKQLDIEGSAEQVIKLYKTIIEE